MLTVEELKQKFENGKISGKDGEIFGLGFTTIQPKGIVEGRKGGKRPHTEESKIQELQAAGRMADAFNGLMHLGKVSADPAVLELVKSVVGRALSKEDINALKIWSKKTKTA